MKGWCRRMCRRLAMTDVVKDVTIIVWYFSVAILNYPYSFFKRLWLWWHQNCWQENHLCLNHFFKYYYCILWLYYKKNIKFYSEISKNLFVSVLTELKQTRHHLQPKDEQGWGPFQPDSYDYPFCSKDFWTPKLLVKKPQFSHIRDVTLCLFNLFSIVFHWIISLVFFSIQFSFL